MIITTVLQNYIFFTYLALYIIGKKGASCRKDHGQRKILIHKREILLSYEQRGGHISTWVWDERNQVRGISYARRGKRLRGKRQCFAGTFASTCKRLRQRLQCFASEKGKTGTWIVSPILDKRKGRRDTPLTSHCSPPLMYLLIPDSTSSMEKSIKTVIRRNWRDFKTETFLT